jgi:hypothetical protein
MRTERTIRHTDTKRILQLCYDNGMTNEGISLRLNCSVRSIQKWWYDTCPSPRFFHRLWMLENSIKKEKEDEEKAIRMQEQRLNDFKARERHRLYWLHREEDGHSESECPQCLVILNLKTE